MNKNFEDILNEKIGKYQKPVEKERKSFSETTMPKPDDVNPQLLRFLDKKLKLGIQVNRYYDLSPKEKHLTQVHTESQKILEPIGYFERTDTVIFAFVYMKNMEIHLPQEISKKQMKKLFRKLLMKHHPDTSDSAMDSADFTQLLQQIKILENAWRPQKEAA